MQSELLLFIFDNLCFFSLSPRLIEFKFPEKEGIIVLFVFTLKKELLIFLFLDNIFCVEEYLFSLPVNDGIFFKYEWAFLNLSPIPNVVL